MVVSPASTPTHLQKEKRKNFYGKFFAPNFIFRNTENIEHKQKTEEKIYENPQTFVNTITGGCHGDDLYCIHVDFFFAFSETISYWFRFLCVSRTIFKFKMLACARQFLKLTGLHFWWILKIYGRHFLVIFWSKNRVIYQSHFYLNFMTKIPFNFPLISGGKNFLLGHCSRECKGVHTFTKCVNDFWDHRKPTLLPWNPLTEKETICWTAKIDRKTTRLELWSR